MAIKSFHLPRWAIGTETKTERTGKQIMKTHLSLSTIPLALACCTAFVLTTMPAAQAESKSEYLWNNPSGFVSTGFATLEQCKAMASGIGGSCDRAPNIPADAYAYAPKGVRDLRK
jgi:hypothetical protein